MNLLFRFLLTINATSWMIILYLINEDFNIFNLPSWIFDISLFLIPVLLSFLSIGLSKFLGKDNLSECSEFNLADNEFLPVYLGYFFLSISIPCGNIKMLLIIYGIVFVFTFLSQTQYFNPIFLLFGYHYYHILTQNGTRIFVIHKGKVIRNKENLRFENLRRINDTTYIEKE